MDKTLLVDDMSEVYKKLQRRFKGADYSPNLEDALRKIREGGYSLIITDYDLGEGSHRGGLEVVREAYKSRIECILMSTENHEEEALKAGATRFVFKKELF